MRRPIEQQQLERARLALITADQTPLGAARHAGDDEAEHPPKTGIASETGLSQEPESAPEAEQSPIHPGLWRRIPKLGREHLPVVLALLVLVVLITLYAFGRSSATELPAPVMSPTVVTSSTPDPSPSPSAESIRVHVLGAVSSPGVVTVPQGAIVQDALHAAGGLTEEADPGELNLAARVSDGQQIIIGTRQAPRGDVVAAEPQPSAGSSTSGSGTLSLNNATAEQLQSLPGVGPVLAQAIIAWRNENGPFTDVSQLREVSGIGPKIFERLAPLVTP